MSQWPDSQRWHELCETNGVMWIAQFGSSAIGRETSSSDMDLSVWLRAITDHGAAQAIALTNALMPLLGRSDVDVVVANTAAPLLQWSIARTGCVLYEREAGAFRRFQLYAWKRHEEAQRVRAWDARFVHGCLEEWARG